MAELRKEVFAIASDITSPIGVGVDVHWQTVAAKSSAIGAYNENGTIYYASKISETQSVNIGQFGNMESELSMFEKLSLFSIKAALANTAATIGADDTVLILSTTKGNIEELNRVGDDNTLLASSAAIIVKELGLNTEPVVISQACVSGAVALLYAHRLLGCGRYKNAIVVGSDQFTPFVLNGFLSFKAIADEPCRPFDADRKGINLGEAAATIILTTDEIQPALGKLSGGATSNDANHISGPSRTGEELADAIKRAMSEAGILATDIDMISAHGTATVYNDEMEANALHLAGLSKVPMHSMKSYTGHTLGAAGVLESVMILKALQEQQLIPSTNFEKSGVTVPVNVTLKMQPAPINYVLKTASGFGGSNAAIIWAKA